MVLNICPTPAERCFLRLPATWAQALQHAIVLAFMDEKKSFPLACLLCLAGKDTFAFHAGVVAIGALFLRGTFSSSSRRVTTYFFVAFTPYGND